MFSGVVVILLIVSCTPFSPAHDTGTMFSSVPFCTFVGVFLVDHSLVVVVLIVLYFRS